MKTFIYSVSIISFLFSSYAFAGRLEDLKDDEKCYKTATAAVLKDYHVIWAEHAYDFTDEKDYKRAERVRNTLNQVILDALKDETKCYDVAKNAVENNFTVDWDQFDFTKSEENTQATRVFHALDKILKGLINDSWSFRRSFPKESPAHGALIIESDRLNKLQEELSEKWSAKFLAG